MKRFLLPLLMVFAIAALLIGTAPANASFVLALDDPGTAGWDIVVIDEQGAGATSTGGVALR